MDINQEQLSEEIQSKYSIVDNTFVNVLEGSRPEHLEVEIGDIKQPDFYPQFKVKRWTNEVNFSARLIDNEIGDPTITTEGDRIKWSKGNLETHFYDIKNEEHPEGANEFEVILKDKPKSNIFDFSIQTKGLKFYYQPALTQKEIDEGAKRPENVVGSYAVYHDSKQGDFSNLAGNNYRVGKFCHIYYPYAKDANGWEVRAEDFKIDTDKELMTIVLPQEFLDKAIYPIIVDPTFGYTTNAATIAQSPAAGVIFGQIHTAGAGVASSMRIRMATTAEGGYITMGLYNNTAFVQKTGAVGYPTAGGSWLASDFISFPTLTAIDYRLSFIVSNNVLSYYYDTGGSYGYYYGSYPTFPDPISWTTSGNNRIIGIYVVYGEPTDAYTKLLLHCNGADASTVIIDTSPAAHIMTPVGTAQLDTAQKEFGTASLLLDGDSDYVTTPDSADWYFASGDFTVDFWARFPAIETAGQNYMLMSHMTDSNNKHVIQLYNNAGTIRAYWQVKESDTLIIDATQLTGALSNNTWYHFAFVRYGNVWTIYLNGTALGTPLTDDSAIPDFSGVLAIGAYNVGGTPILFFSGWLDEFRIRKGIATWTANFSVPDREYSDIYDGTGGGAARPHLLSCLGCGA